LTDVFKFIVYAVYITELVPHFEQSDAAYIGYPGITDAYEKFDLEISFKPQATDGQSSFTVVIHYVELCHVAPF